MDHSFLNQSSNQQNPKFTAFLRNNHGLNIDIFYFSATDHDFDLSDFKNTPLMKVTIFYEAESINCNILCSVTKHKFEGWLVIFVVLQINKIKKNFFLKFKNI